MISANKPGRIPGVSSLPSFLRLIPVFAALCAGPLASAAEELSGPPPPPPAAEEPVPTIASPHAYEYAFGVRLGFPVDNDFILTELYGAWSPEGWYYDFNDNFRFRIGVTGAVGALVDNSRDAAIFVHAGPVFEIVHRPTGLRIVGRSEPAYMSQHSLGGVDLGEDFQFVSSIGIFWWPPSRIHWGAGVAIQHISNAGISNINPGTEHIVLSLGFAF